VKLFKSGNQLKMSKRAGDFITASDLINEVGKDSVRFMMIYRSRRVLS
jgi:arginyl-tRNA synthetase